MTHWHADLHIHSKYSRATSRDLDLEHIGYWASRKGISVVATGDFTHPAWFAELKEKLVPAEPGLFRLRSEAERWGAERLPAACQATVRFMLSVEISTIYKKDDRTRKIHHLLYAPDFETAERITSRLAQIGNVASDGRPILGLDSRDLLEITLEAGPGAYLVPAHIWTPWFAVLGSQSGFDSVEDCYGDLADHIFAVETGLSSDPQMNWRLSPLDRYRLVSSSDAHSPGKLGREGTLFDCELDYYAIRRALETGRGYVGTAEFFPEEGKYHLDGHRKCGVRLEPKETLANDGRCPACGQRATVGVLHRVEVLADRSEEEAAPPPKAGEVASLVPLQEILSEIIGKGPKTKTVTRSYDRLLSALGPELSILRTVPVEDIERAESSLLAEAIARLRAGRVIRHAGYDGEYGVIRLFEEPELARLKEGGVLFDLPQPQVKATTHTEATPSPSNSPPVEQTAVKEEPASYQPDLLHASPGVLASLDADQRAAAQVVTGPLLIVAGPGSGKTRALTHRIAHLVANCAIDATGCLAITFTRRAAAEMSERLADLLPGGTNQPAIHTFHSFGLAILREHGEAAGLPPGFRIAGEPERIAALAQALELPERKAAALLRGISKAKRSPASLNADVERVMSTYQETLASRNWVDFDDVIRLSVRTLSEDPGIAEHYRERFQSISVDEFQDVDEEQYRLLTLLAPPGGDSANLCVIGDPNQAIYGFRGADATCFDRFRRDYPDAAIVDLKRNYRSTGTIVAASSQLIAGSAQGEIVADVVREMRDRITIHTSPTDRAEAEFVVQMIEATIGGHSFFSIDSGRATGTASGGLSFADFAVLYRTDAQSATLVEALARSGMPFKKNSHDLLAAQPHVRALLQELGERRGETGKELTAQLRAAAERVERRDDAPEPALLRAGLQRLTTLAETCTREHRPFDDAVALAAETDFWDPRADRVSLLTLHAAKGLEFAVVFIVGLEDGVLPLYWAEPDEATKAEERRLLYVGMTRAKDQLILSHAHRRLWRGSQRAFEPSPFLSDIEQALLERHQPQPARTSAADDQLALF